MQDYIDKKFEEIKVLSNFDISQESVFLNLSVYEFYFHVWVKSNQKE